MSEASDRPGDPFETIRVATIAAALEAVITVDDEQRIVMINPAALRMFGCTAADVLERDMSCLIPERLREAHVGHVREFKRSSATELPRRALRQMIGMRANGEEFPMEVAVSRVECVEALGTRRYITVLLRDIGPEKALHDEVDALRRRMRAIFELAPVAIWLTEGERIVFSNRACASLFRVGDSAELIGRSIYELLEPSSHTTVRQHIAHTLAGGESVNTLSERIQAMDGDVREVEIAVARLPDHGRAALQMVITDITEQRRERDELNRSRSELRRLSANLVTAREQERQRIARELHDELGQWLTAFKMEVSSLATPAARGKLGQRVAQLGGMIDEMMLAVRRIATDLRPSMLDDLGLNATLEWLVRESARRMGIQITLKLDEADPPVSESASIALYRMTQEALTNIARHAQATEVSIEVAHARDQVTLTVTDNGVGFSPMTMRRDDSHGLVGMRERALMFGGDIELGNRPGGGAFVAIRLPVDSDASTAGETARPETT